MSIDNLYTRSIEPDQELDNCQAAWQGTWPCLAHTSLGVNALQGWVTDALCDHLAECDKIEEIGVKEILFPYSQV